MKKTINCLFIATMVSLAIFSGAVAKEGAEKPVALDFKLQDLNEKFVSLSDYKGKSPVIIIFWTTWCPYCREELGELNKRYAELAKDGIKVIAIDVREPVSIVKAFLKKQPLIFDVLLDSDARAAHSYNVLGVPTYVLVNKEGLVVYEDNYFPEDKYKELLLQ